MENGKEIGLRLLPLTRTLFHFPFSMFHPGAQRRVRRLPPTDLFSIFHLPSTIPARSAGCAERRESGNINRHFSRQIRGFHDVRPFQMAHDQA
jgi:hypothetical protein